MSEPSRITIFTGAKGGVGTTTLCVDLIRHLRTERPCALVDADFSGRRSIAVLTDSVRNFDAGRPGENLAAATILEDVSGIEFTSSINGAFTLTLEQVEGLIDPIAEDRTVVVDAPQPYAAAVRPFIVRAAHYVIALEPTLLGVTGARSVQTEFGRFGLSPKRVFFVLIDRDGKPEVRADEIERILGVRLLATIPPRSDRRYPRALAHLADVLAKVEVPDQLEPIKPSVKVPLGDRRPVKNRAPQAGAAAEQDETRGDARRRTAPVANAARDALKGDIHRALATKLDLVTAGGSGDEARKLAELRAQVEALVNEMLEAYPTIFSAEELARVRQEVIDEALGYGPLEEFLAQPDVTEVMVNGRHQIYIERDGKIEATSKAFTDDRQLRVVIERIIAPLGRRIDESVPMVDARLPDGSRVNAVIEPLALDGPMLTIRRFGTRRLNSSDLVRLGAVEPQMLDFLRAAVEARLNIVISGGTGSGKTTFLNALSAYIPESDRIVTIEDAAELRLQQSHVCRMESRPANIQGAGEVRIRDLVRNALRMRPDRIIVGECRGGEALDMLQAMNTGHDGSLTTIHANSARDAIARIETMVLMAGFDLPLRAIREQIAGAIDLIIHTSRMRDGSRKVIGISEVAGLEGDVVTMQEIVRYRQHGLDLAGKVSGEFEFTGVQPECVRRFEEFGVSFSTSTLGQLTTAKPSSW